MKTLVEALAELKHFVPGKGGSKPLARNEEKNAEQAGMAFVQSGGDEKVLHAKLVCFISCNKGHKAKACIK